MTLTIYDIETVSLSGTITGSALDLAYGQDPLSANGDSLFDELDSLDEAEIVLPDFVQGGVTYEVHAWEEEPTGGLTKWSRNGSQSESGMRDDLDADVLVIAVPSGDRVPEPSSTGGPPAPGTGQTVKHIKIRKQGSTPF